MNIKRFFTSPSLPQQKLYEALRAIYVEKRSEREVAAKFKMSLRYLRQVQKDVSSQLEKGEPPFFLVKKPGPKGQRIGDETKETIVSLRKKNKSGEDIKSYLDAQGISISLRTIHRTLKAEGFSRLPKRTRQEKKEQESIKATPPACEVLEIKMKSLLQLLLLQR